MFSIRNPFYCRLVELEKLRLRTRKDEEKVVNDLNGVDPFLVIRLVISFNKTCLSLAKKKLLKTPVYSKYQSGFKAVRASCVQYTFTIYNY